MRDGLTVDGDGSGHAGRAALNGALLSARYEADGLLDPIVMTRLVDGHRKKQKNRSRVARAREQAGCSLMES